MRYCRICRTGGGRPHSGWTGLSRLEYRGYDSAASRFTGRREGLQVVKAKGRLQVLQDLVQGGRTVHGTLGLGHTRWATHGEPSDVNSHPQVSESGRFAVVHNGIIENYMELREFLQSEGLPSSPRRIPRWWPNCWNTTMTGISWTRW